jgi:hypothetical protein
MGRGGVLLGLVMLADFVVMGRLVVVMGGGGMAGRRLMMMLGGGVLSLVGHNRSPGLGLSGARSVYRESIADGLARPVQPQSMCRGPWFFRKDKHI